LPDGSAAGVAPWLGDPSLGCPHLHPSP
jgi:hypothetical protein